MENVDAQCAIHILALKSSCSNIMKIDVSIGCFYNIFDRYQMVIFSLIRIEIYDNIIFYGMRCR